jgi:hypothetical protein
MGECRRVRDDCIRSERLAGGIVRFERGAVESMEHCGRHAALGRYVAVLEGFPTGQQPGICGDVSEEPHRTK